MENSLTVDYFKVIPCSLDKVWDENNLTKMLDYGIMERRRILSTLGYDLALSYSHVKKRADEIAYNASRYIDKNDVQKAVIAANIAFNSAKVIDFLRDSDDVYFGVNYLLKYVSLINKFGNNSKPLKDMTDIENKEYIFFKKYTKLLVLKFSKYYGNVLPHHVINIVNQVVSMNYALLNNNTVLRDYHQMCLRNYEKSMHM